ncbi:protein TolR [Allorhizobium sp. BGMRC 0089]|uniref:protein TolR n=1 Tax=Allorhizobium sonneratiae TaxID=2934936 RepID=UPI002034309A|nr:protein TolR [Allorhizobium sonneratiae]MCM2290920.1 protein TolR [Allorhizobium sonneratiae]
MGMSAGAGGAGGGGRRGRRSRGGKRGLVSEINVTPLVDVMLVLLIIFMVAAPMLTVGVPIDLPQTKASPMNSDTQPITISVNKEGDVYIQDQKIDVNDVVDKLKAIATTGYNERIYVRGDTTAAYGTVMKVMAQISTAGFKNIGLVTQQEQDK